MSKIHLVVLQTANRSHPNLDLSPAAVRAHVNATLFFRDTQCLHAFQCGNQYGSAGKAAE